jgi:hypothetical protein
VLFEQHAADIYIREIGLHNRLQLSIYCYAYAITQIVLLSYEGQGSKPVPDLDCAWHAWSCGGNVTYMRIYGDSCFQNFLSLIALYLSTFDFNL